MMGMANGFTKGMIAGIAVGSAVGLVLKSSNKTKRMFRKKANRAMHVVGSVLDNMTR